MTQLTDVDTDQAAADGGDVEVQDARLDELPPHRNNQGIGKIDLLLDTTVEVSAVLGSARMPIGELLRMGTGSVIPLDREAGQPVDLLLNGILFAKGHLVVVGERMAIRLTEVQVPDDEADGDSGAETGDGEAPEAS